MRGMLQLRCGRAPNLVANFVANFVELRKPSEFPQGFGVRHSKTLSRVPEPNRKQDHRIDKVYDEVSDKVRFTGIGLFLVILTLIFLPLGAGADEMRFPAPEFRSGYEFPGTTVPSTASQTQEWIDVAVLLGALSLGSWLAVKRRSRRGIFWLMIFSLGYFGFFRQGCICPIGSIQNVALSLFNSNYAVPLTVTIFFVLPLLFALFLGRIFCASVCPLGAIQDLVILKPLQLPRKLTVALSMIPYVYISLAVVFAVTNSGFIICRYDPFIGFFRLSGNAPYLYLGAGFLLAGIFIARPYCRFFCPYGVLLGLMSRFSRAHVAITPTNCVNCRLCEKSCPFDYIDKPNVGFEREPRNVGVRRLGYLFAMLPVLIVLGGWIGNQLATPMSRYNRTVALAEQVIVEKMDPALEPTLETDAFRAAGTPDEELFAQALTIRAQMKTGGWLLGGFIGLVFGFKLIGLSTVRTRKDYQINKTHCFSCARCCDYCPSDDQHKINFIPGSPAYAQALALEKPELMPAQKEPVVQEKV
jgi:NosR/NirI family transcriptional regulator, nitrous oxide reductase regulator